MVRMVMVTKGHNERAKDQTSQYGITDETETKERPKPNPNQ